MSLSAEIESLISDLTENGAVQISYQFGLAIPELETAKMILTDGPDRCARRIDAVKNAALPHQDDPSAMAALSFENLEHPALFDRPKQIELAIRGSNLDSTDLIKSSRNTLRKLVDFLASYPADASAIIGKRKCLDTAAKLQKNEEVARWLKAGMSFSREIFTADGRVLFNER